MRKTQNWTEAWDDAEQVPFMFKDNQWISFENVKSMEAKVSGVC
jgi:GH18 family chitinase